MRKPYDYYTTDIEARVNTRITIKYPACRWCSRPTMEHVRNKCLFEHTTFEAGPETVVATIGSDGALQWMAP